MNKGDFNSTILIKAHGQTMYELDRWDAEFEFSKIFEILRAVYDSNRKHWKIKHRSSAIQSVEIWQRIEWVDSGDNKSTVEVSKKVSDSDKKDASKLVTGENEEVMTTTYNDYY
jgi:hypothetical protein